MTMMTPFMHHTKPKCSDVDINNDGHQVDCYSQWTRHSDKCLVNNIQIYDSKPIAQIDETDPLLGQRQTSQSCSLEPESLMGSW